MSPSCRWRNFAPAAAVASALVGFAVDFVQQQLKNEAELYQAQFGTTVPDEKFWMLTTNLSGRATTFKVHKATHSLVTTKEKKTPKGGATQEEEIETDRTSSVDETEEVTKTVGHYSPHYFGFRMRRYVKNEKLPAFELVCGIAPTTDGTMLRVAPLFFQTRKAMAKVLSDEWWTIPFFWTWAGKLVSVPGNHLNTSVDVEIDGYWVDKDQTAKITKLAIIPMKFDGYDISNKKPADPKATSEPSPIRVSDGTLKQSASGFFAPVPISLDPEGKPITEKEDMPYLGNFTIKINVTESDPSNAKQDLEQAAKWVSEQKPNVVGLVPK